VTTLAAEPATNPVVANEAVDAFRSLTSLLEAGPLRDPTTSRAASTIEATDGSQPLAFQSLIVSPAPAQPAVTDAAPVAADIAQPHLKEAVGGDKWADALAARLTVMATRGEQHGSLRLSPEHLGPLEVQIRLQDDKASVWFGAQHADTRAALQDALPRLRELFAAQGMQLGDAGVSREAPRQDRVPTGFAPGAALADSADGEVLAAITPVAATRHDGLLDTYA
jgi:flagellar hook-length control protein FliK